MRKFYRSYSYSDCSMALVNVIIYLVLPSLIMIKFIFKFKSSIWKFFKWYGNHKRSFMCSVSWFFCMFFSFFIVRCFFFFLNRIDRSRACFLKKQKQNVYLENLINECNSSPWKPEKYCDKINGDDRNLNTNKVYLKANTQTNVKVKVNSKSKRKHKSKHDGV